MSPAVGYRTAKPQAFIKPLGPFIGMRDSIDPTSSEQGWARLLRNVYPREPHHLSSVIGRPGFDQVGAQLGSGGDVQFLGQFTELDGTEHTIAIVGGKFYTLDWSTDTWTEVLTASDFSSASITVSSTARFYAVTFANGIVFSDGANKPWSWDGTTNGGLTSLTNAPVAFGPPTVYYGKLFFVKSTERSTFVWSEENQPNTGYEAGGFNNAWTLGQTDANRITRLLGANEALYVFREYSITQVVGEVTTNFASTGTREAVSSTTGTSAPASVAFANNVVVFADSQGRPHAFAPGSEPAPLWENFDQTIRTMDSTKFDEIEAVYDTELDLIRFGYEAQGEEERSTQLCYHFEGGHLPTAACIFDGYTFTRIGIVKNGDGEPRVMHGSTDGYTYVHGTLLGSIWNDGHNSGDRPIVHEVKTNLVAYSERTESHFIRADIVVVTRTDATITVRSETNTSISDATTLSFDGGVAVWDVSEWDDGIWGEGTDVQHGAVGLNAFGFYCGLNLSHSSGSERFQLVSAQIQGRPVSMYPGMP